MLPHFYTAPGTFSSPTHGVIVLPEIYGLNAHTKKVADRFADTFSVPAFGMDFFSLLTEGTPTDFDYVTEQAKGLDLMGKMTGELFMEGFCTLMDHIQSLYPSITSFTVVGFCFGGKLTFLTGRESRVTQLISFYGGAVHQPFYKGRTVIEELRGQAKGRTDLRVLAFFGKKDDYIPEAERAHTKMFIKQAVLPYEEVLYPTGHAFFNADRTTYDEPYALQAWEKVVSWWNTKSV